MRHFNSDDDKIYTAWMRRTGAIYAGLILLGVVAIGTLSVTRAPTTAAYLGEAVALASP